MNVLRADFISKQKRLQSRRQKIVKTFFSGYHTITNVGPDISFFKLPRTSGNSVRNQIDGNIEFPSSHVNESVEPKSFGIYSSDATTSRSEALNLQHLFEKQDNSTSTTSEFRKLLEPFKDYKPQQVPSTSEECFEGSNIFENYGRNVSHKYLDEREEEEEEEEEGEEMEFPFQNHKNNTTWGDTTKLQMPISAPQDSSIFSKDAFGQFNVFDLSVPKNQRSIEEILSAKSALFNEVTEEVILTPNNKKIKKTSSDVKTPKNKIRKSPKVSGSSKNVSSESGAFILAVTEGRGHARGEVGIAAMDPRRPHLVLCQISDNQKYIHSLTKMNVFPFVEVIVPNTFVDCSSPNKLYSDIRTTFPKVTLTSVQRRHFNESLGIDLIKQYCSLESNSVMVLLKDKFYALSAAAALIKYIEFTQNVRLAPQTLKIEYQGMEDTMIIDLNTANLLELVLCANHPETNLNHSLLGVVKYCHTKGGLRLLRANILQPPCSLTKILTRLDCVSELVNNPLLMCALEARFKEFYLGKRNFHFSEGLEWKYGKVLFQAAVSNFSSLEDLLNLCMHAPQQDGLRVAEYQLKYTLLLKSMLELLPSLRNALQEAKSQFFYSVRENLEDVRYGIILERILETVFENAKTVKGSVSAHLHGCFAIKAGINSLLDIAKKTYCEIVQEISDHVSELREKHDMSLRLAFSAHKGFHIQYTLPLAQRNITESSLPKEFILAQKSKTTFSFYTTELVALDQRSQHVLNEIKLMTNVILFDLLTDIRQHIGCLFNLCEFISELDILISFAHVSSGTNYVRPEFGEELNLKNSRHPILDVIHDGGVVPNDVFANSEKNLIILTGPNQSGKSIYIRQIALLQIMAQIGCYVPAKEATFKLTDRIFSRIGFDDSIESNASTLIVEMKDIEYIKQNITNRSLVIIDELCRGTSVDEGTSLAFAICEQLLDTKAFVFFTTHYLLLTKLEEMYFNVSNYHFETKMEMKETGKNYLQFTHQRQKGATKSDLYGLRVAEMTSFPKDVYAKAKLIAQELSKDKKPCREVNGLLAEYNLSLKFRDQLVKCEPENNFHKMAEIIEEFKEIHKNLNYKFEEESLLKSFEKLCSENLECVKSPCLGRERIKKSKSLIKKLHPGGRFKKPLEPEKIHMKNIQKLATRIKKKYRKLNMKN